MYYNNERLTMKKIKILGKYLCTNHNYIQL